MDKIQRAFDKATAQREATLFELPGPRAGAPKPVSPPSTPPPVTTPPLQPGLRLDAASPRALARGRVVAAASGRASDAFRMLRTQVLGRLDAMGGTALAVSSPKQGDGKTVVAVNLAVSVARHLHRRALLVDLDFRRPGVAKCLGLAPPADFSDYLEGRVALADCLVDPGINRLMILAQRRTVEHSSELLAAPHMTELARELARDPDRLVVYDCPPLLATDDALIALGFAAGCLLVLREGRTTHGELARAAELIGPERLLGTVLNGAVWSFASGYESGAYSGHA